MYVESKQPNVQNDPFSIWSQSCLKLDFCRCIRSISKTRHILPSTTGTFMFKVSLWLIYNAFALKNSITGSKQCHVKRFYNKPLFETIKFVIFPREFINRWFKILNRFQDHFNLATILVATAYENIQNIIFTDYWSVLAELLPSILLMEDHLSDIPYQSYLYVYA